MKNVVPKISKKNKDDVATEKVSEECAFCSVKIPYRHIIAANFTPLASPERQDVTLFVFDK